MKNDLAMLWEEMLRLTENILQLVKSGEYEQLEKAVDQRENVIERLKEYPEHGELGELIGKVLALDEEVIRTARQGKVDMEKTLRSMQHSRRAIQGYEHDLNFTLEPIFFDRKK